MFIKYLVFSCLAIVFIFTSFFNKAYSIDHVKLQMQQLSENKAAHTVEVIRRALEVTEPEHGAFKLDVIKILMSGSRMSHSLQQGELINTLFLPANKAWDEKHLVVRVPVRLGMLNYRLLLVNKEDVSKFDKITTLSELNQFKAGLASDWQTTKIYHHHKLKNVKTGHFRGIYSMLAKRRFDYLPRGFYEVYDELEARKTTLDNIVIEPTIALNIPMYTYVYVSRETPLIAKRLKTGLNKMLESGELKIILLKYFNDAIIRSKINKRKIIKIENPYYDKEEQNIYDHLIF